MAVVATYHAAFHPAPLLEPQRGFCPKAQGCAVPRATLGARGRVPATTTWLCRGNERAPCPAQALLRSRPLAGNPSTVAPIRGSPPILNS